MFYLILWNLLIRCRILTKPQLLEESSSHEAFFICSAKSLYKTLKALTLLATITDILTTHHNLLTNILPIPFTYTYVHQMLILTAFLDSEFVFYIIVLCSMETRRGAAIPYWESGLDHDMVEPTTSVLTSDRIFGNCYVQVMNEPFRNMREHEITSYQKLWNWSAIVLFLGFFLLYVNYLFLVNKVHL